MKLVQDFVRMLVAAPLFVSIRFSASFRRKPEPAGLSQMELKRASQVPLIIPYLKRSSNVVKSFAVAMASPNAVCLPSTLISNNSKALSDETAFCFIRPERYR